MAYLDRTPDPRGRTTAITGVVIVHAALAYVLLTGLAAHFVGHERDKFTGYFDPAPPPPPPTPEPRQTHKPDRPAETPTAPKPQTPLTKPNDQVAVTPKTDKIDAIPTATPTYPPYEPPHAARFEPKAASPTNNPGTWAMTDDYPSRELRLGIEGTTAFRVVIGTNGRVSACEIVRSSGHPALDAATCKAVAARARFEPATDENGGKVVGTYTSSVRWQIPR